jgi:hypothetical protein
MTNELGVLPEIKLMIAATNVKWRIVCFTTVAPHVVVHPGQASVSGLSRPPGPISQQRQRTSTRCSASSCTRTNRRRTLLDRRVPLGARSPVRQRSAATMEPELEPSERHQVSDHRTGLPRALLLTAHTEEVTGDPSTAHPSQRPIRPSPGVKDLLTVSVQRWRSQVQHPTTTWTSRYLMPTTMESGPSRCCT